MPSQACNPEANLTPSTRPLSSVTTGAADVAPWVDAWTGSVEASNDNAATDVNFMALTPNG